MNRTGTRQLPFPFTLGDTLTFTGSHHHGWTPIGLLWVDDGFGHAIRNPNLLSAIHFLADWQ